MYRNWKREGSGSKLSNSFKAQLLRAVIESQDKMSKGVLAVKDITDTYNRGRLGQNPLSPIAVGRMLRAMGFEPKRLSDGTRGIPWDEAIMARLQRQYRLADLSEVSNPSEAQAASSNIVDGSSDRSLDRSENHPPIGPTTRTCSTGIPDSSDRSDRSDGWVNLVNGPSYTPLSFAHLFREKNVNRALIGAGDILNRLMAERNIRWNALCDHIRERYPAVWEKHREEERQLFAWAEACRHGGDAARWETFHRALKAVLALRIYWIGLYSAYQRQGGGTSGSPETIPK